MKLLKYLIAQSNRVRNRLKEPNRHKNRAKAKLWCEKNAIDSVKFIKSINEVYADEAIEYNDELISHSKKILKAIPFTMGGGADSTLVYFFTRLLKPDIIVETGVSMGFSSHAFLSAIKRNGKGHLFSSDLPYFMEKNAEKYVGCMVPEELRDSWKIYLNGDRKNLSIIINEINKIDIFHYDSDKSVSGRKFALKKLSQLLTKQTLIIFDDIDINLHFKEFADKFNNCKVLKKPNGDYVGIILPELDTKS
jgi:predicted O-methyltransferase YrrM